MKGVTLKSKELSKESKESSWFEIQRALNICFLDTS